MSLAATFSRLQRLGCVANVTPDLVSSVSALLSVPRPVGAPPPSVYAGFDPTAPSLHLGHAAVLVFLRRLATAGLRPIALVGGATALIGDPTGKSQDRAVLSIASVRANSARMSAFLQHVLGDDALVLDNAAFYEGLSALDFLRDVGGHFRLATLLQRETVRERMGWEKGGGGGTARDTPATGMSFTEFSYPLLQSHDFSTLRRTHGAVLQIGGADQWGNIAAGVDHIHRVDGSGVVAHGATVPLLVDPSGRKFGKSEGNVPVWLDPSLTSHHSLWQEVFATHDAAVPALLRSLSLAPDDAIDAALADLASTPERKAAQRLLADGVVEFFRGPAALASAQRTAAILFGGGKALLGTLRAEDVLALAAEGEVPLARARRADVNESSASASVPALLVTAGLASSRAEARRLISGGGVYWNWERVSTREGAWRTADGTAPRSPRADAVDFIDSRVAILGVGKKSMAVISLTDD